MFRFILAVLLFSLTPLLPLYAANTAEGLQNQPVYYPIEGSQQPLMGVKITSVGWSGHPLKMVFVLSDSTAPGDVKNFKLWASGTNAFFNPGGNTDLTSSGTFSQEGRTITYTASNGEASYQGAGNYLWLTSEISAKALPNAEIDVACTSLNLNGQSMVLTDTAPEGAGYVFPFRKRVIPYYRARWVMDINGNKGWGNWSDSYMNFATDIIVFCIGCRADGTIYPADATAVSLDSVLLKLQAARTAQKSKTRLLIGMGAGCDVPLTTVTANDALTDKLVLEIVDFIRTRKLDGIDIDWEYPDTATDWANYTKFMAKLKIALFPLGATLSSAVNANYKQPTAAFMHLLDFANFMSYDNGGEHSTYARFINDINWAKNSGLPEYKIVGGLPFYGMVLGDYTADGTTSRWDAQTGYAGIVRLNPNLLPSDNYVTHPTYGPLYFNGIDMIKKKAKVLLSSNIGGVMIWAFDNDVPFTDTRSLARALQDVIPQVVDTPPVIKGNVYQIESSENLSWFIRKDAGNVAEVTRPFTIYESFTGYNGLTGTLRGIDSAQSVITLDRNANRLNPLFGNISGVLEKLRFEGYCDVTSAGNGGLIAASVSGGGTCQHVRATLHKGATISGANNVGAFFGEMYSGAPVTRIQNCEFDVKGTVRSTTYGRTGGIVGHLNTANSGTTFIDSIRLHLDSTALIQTPAGTSYAGVGGIVGNRNYATSRVESVLAYFSEGAKLQNLTNNNLGYVVGANGAGTNGLANIACVIEGEATLDTTGVTYVLEYQPQLEIRNDSVSLFGTAIDIPVSGLSPDSPFIIENGYLRYTGGESRKNAKFTLKFTPPSVPEFTLDFKAYAENLNALIHTQLFATASEITITWDPIENAEYQIERKTTTGDYAVIGDWQSENKYIDITAVPGVTYTYRITVRERMP